MKLGGTRRASPPTVGKARPRKKWASVDFLAHFRVRFDSYSESECLLPSADVFDGAGRRRFGGAAFPREGSFFNHHGSLDTTTFQKARGFSNERLAPTLRPEIGDAEGRRSV